MAPQPPSLLHTEPVPQLLQRVAGELAASFDPARPIRISRAPGRLDVMGGIADYTGSMVCESPLDRAAAVALQGRNDRQVQVFSFNLFDEHKPFTFQVPLDALTAHPIQKLRQEFEQAGRHWAAYLVGTLIILHEQKLLDLRDPSLRGVNIALLSTVPLGAGVSSSAAIEVATMMNVVDHYNIPRSDSPTPGAIDPLRLSALCQSVENQIVGAPCGIMDQVASCYGKQGELLRMICQPHELQPSLTLPEGVRVLGINSNVKHSVGGGMYGKTRCAAFMAHSIILEKIREMGAATGHQLHGDPMRGYLANVDPEDYKRLFRPHLPETIGGLAFLEKYGPTIDTATVINPSIDYHVQHAADHHVLEAMRVRNFVSFIEQASQELIGTPRRKLLLDKAGHLMYASHLSYTNDAMLGADECDLLVDLVRKNERAGLYGAKITGGGSGGTVAILANTGPQVDEAIATIMQKYESQTGQKPEAFLASSNGAWHMGTQVIDRT